MVGEGMKKKALRKDFFVEVRKSRNRFLSILFIVALGVSFYSGIQSAAPDMKRSGDVYFDREKLMDLKVVSTLGLTEEDLLELEKTKGIEKAEGAYMTDVLCGEGDNQKVLHLESVTEDFQKLQPDEGALPSKADECFLDAQAAQAFDVHVGDTITVQEEGEERDSVLKRKTFTVAGIGGSPAYIAFSRGNTMLGSGEVLGFCYILPENFDMDVYTQVFLSVEGAEEEIAFTDAYDSLVATAKEKVEELSEKRCQVRYDEVTGEAQEKIDDAKQELADGRKESDEKLAAAEKTLTDGEEELEQGKKDLEDGKKQLSEARTQLDEQKTALDEQEEQLKTAEAQFGGSTPEIEAGKTKIAEAREQLSEGEKELETKESELAKAEETIKENETKLADGRKDYEEAKKEAEDKIAEGEDKIADAEADLAALEFPAWTVSDRNDMTDYSGYADNANQMKSLGAVFPVLFFLVAALISLTTMTRMVEEERTQIGTLKALGYSKSSIAGKYVFYALLATVGGSVLGVLAGEKIFPYVIIDAYRIMYQHMDGMVLDYQLDHALVASLVALFCTMAGTLSACGKELASTPAVLMRPPAPKEGKRVFLERIGFIWKHLSFSWKSTVRNLFRYKKRLFMTVFGIGGCMALLLVGFGLRDSIMDVVLLQYGEIQLYDGMLVLNEDASDAEVEALKKDLSSRSDVEESMDVYMKKHAAKGENGTCEVYLMMPEKLENFSDFIHTRNRITKEAYTLGDEGIILAEKTAKMLGVKSGGSITVESRDGEDVEVPVAEICENYMQNFAYISPGLYEKLFGSVPEANNILFKGTDSSDEAAIEKTGQELLKNKAALSVTYIGTLAERLNSMLGSLDVVIVVLIISAGMLAFVVLYNLNNININERKRELATLKVLGFFDGEVSSYVFRENILLTVFGCILGVVLGSALHRYVITTVEIESYMFGRIIKLPSYLISIAITFCFSILVNLLMHFKLKKIDMVESLKSVE